MVNTVRIFSAVLCINAAWSGAAFADDVRAAIQAALGHDPRVALAKSATNAAKGDKLSSLSGFLPTIEGSVSYTDDDFRSSSLDTLQERDGTTLGVTVSQPVFQSFSDINRFREASKSVKQQKYLEENARNQVALTAAQAHAGTVLHREIIQHRNENIKLLSRQYEISLRRMQAGAQSKTGVEQAQMRRDQAIVDMEQTRATLVAAEANYERTIGARPENLTPDDGAMFSGLGSLAEVTGRGLRKSPALNAARHGADAAKMGLFAARGDFGPKAFLEGSYFNRLRQQSGLVNEEEYQVVARVKVPIFSGGKNIGSLRRASAQYAQSKAEYTNANLALREAVARSWRQMKAAESRRIAAKGAIAAAKNAVRGLEIEYEAGQRNVIDVLDGQRDLVNAKVSLSQAEYDYRVAGYELLATLGDLAGGGTIAARPEVEPLDLATIDFGDGKPGDAVIEPIVKNTIKPNQTLVQPSQHTDVAGMTIPGVAPVTTLGDVPEASTKAVSVKTVALKKPNGPKEIPIKMFSVFNAFEVVLEKGEALEPAKEQVHNLAHFSLYFDTNSLVVIDIPTVKPDYYNISPASAALMRFDSDPASTACMP